MAGGIVVIFLIVVAVLAPVLTKWFGHPIDEYHIDQIDPTTKPLVYDDTSKAGQALQNKQVDAIVADLPTAYYLTAAEIDGSKIVGEFQPTSGTQEKFGLLLSKGSALTSCASAAVDALAKDGTLADLQATWLTSATDVPELK